MVTEEVKLKSFTGGKQGGMLHRERKNMDHSGNATCNNGPEEESFLGYFCDPSFPHHEMQCLFSDLFVPLMIKSAHTMVGGSQEVRR